MQFRGFTVCACVPPVIEAAEALFGEKVPITQGGYSGNVEESAGTHDEGGVWDNRIRQMPADKQLRWIECVRTVGGWGWIRTSPPFPTRHGHLFVIGCPHLSPEAKAQERDAFNGIDGLAGHDRTDPHTSLGLRPVLHADYLSTEDNMPLNEADKKWLTEMVDSKFAYQNRTYLAPIAKGIALINTNVWKAINAVRAIPGGTGTPVDAKAVAAEVTAALGDSLADGVADELADRLKE